MRKSIILLVVLALLAGFGLMSCKNEVATQDTLSEVCISLSESRNVIGTVTSSIPPVSDLYWYYVATKNDKGLYATGATTWKAVQEGKGLTEGTVLDHFSQGKWLFSFYGYESVPNGKPQDPKTAAVYYAEGIEVVVNNATTTVDIALTVGTIMNGKVVLGDLSFDLKHVADDVQFNADAEGSFKLYFKNGGTTLSQSAPVTYQSTTTEYHFELSPSEITDIADGAYTYTFEVEFTDGDNNSIVVATEDVGVTISKGVIVTFSGDVFYSDPVDEVVIGEITGEKQATASFTVTSGKSVTVSAAVSPASAASTAAIASTSVEIPADALSNPGDYSMSIDVAEAGLPYEAEGDDHGKTVAAQIDLNLFFNEEPVTNFEGVVKVTTYIAKNLTEVILKYDGNAYTRYSSEIATGSAEKDHYFYNPIDGKLVIYTDHFSNYYVDSADEAVNLTTNIAYRTLIEAVKDSELNEGDTIRLLKDITFTDATVNGARYEINKSVTIDGNGKTIKDTYVRTFRFGNNCSSPLKSVAIENLSVENTSTGNSMCVMVGNVKNITLESVTLESKGSGYQQALTIGSAATNEPIVSIKDSSLIAKNHYAIIAFMPSSIEVSNSSIEAWSALYIKSDATNTLANISDTILTCKNYNTTGWNTFGAVVCECSHASVTISDCTIDVSMVSSEAEVFQYVFMTSQWSGPNSDNTYRIEGSLSLTGGDNCLYLPPTTIGYDKVCFSEDLYEVLSQHTVYEIVKCEEGYCLDLSEDYSPIVAVFENFFDQDDYALGFSGDDLENTAKYAISYIAEKYPGYEYELLTYKLFESDDFEFSDEKKDENNYSYWILTEKEMN